MKRLLVILLVLSMLLFTACASTDKYEEGYLDGYSEAAKEYEGIIEELHNEVDTAMEYSSMLENSFDFYKPYAVLVTDNDPCYHVWDACIPKEGSRICTATEAEQMGYIACDFCYTLEAYD